MKTSNSGVNLIKGFEGLRLKAYDDGVGVWTIGFGTIKYPNGVRVKKVMYALNLKRKNICVMI